ncbi:MAG: TraR/DksA C4-type zinc finger protein [Vicinamibacterales bacterium]
MKRADSRRQRLRTALNAHRREARVALQSRIRRGRVDRSAGVGDPLEQADADNQTDLEFALAQMRAETLNRITQALARLEAGHYGACAECEGDISESRLLALPFAIRCLDCAQLHERSLAARPRVLSDPDGPPSFAPRVWP